jgi:quercetin dioxygenase-like cupin family protein
MKHATVFETMPVEALRLRKIAFAEVGDYVPGHDHTTGHITMVARGRVRFRCVQSGVDCEVVPPGCIYTPAGALHDMIALAADSEAWCIFVAITD